jgi:tetratricopeptide (TPR) repeat protein
MFLVFRHARLYVWTQLQQAAGKVEERLGNFARARDYYSVSLRLQPSAPALVAYAMLELRHPSGNNMNQQETSSASAPQQKANLTMVEKLFEEALLIDPRHGPTYNAYGGLALRQGDVHKARRIFDSGVRAHCNDPASVYHGYARLELAAKNVDLARSILTVGLQEVQQQQEGLRMMETQQRQQHRAHFLVHTLGMLELKESNILQARDVFVKGLEQYGNSSQLLLGAALCDVKLGQQHSARKYFEGAVHADRRHAHAWHAWGIMEQRAGNYKVAKTLFESGLQHSSKHGSLWQSYASMERRVGNMKTARILYAAGVAKCPNHTPLYQGWASLEMLAENLDAAKKLIGEALTRDKTQGSGWLIAARIEEMQGRDGLVGMILRRGLECAPTSPELYSALADDLMKRRKVNEARKILEQGLDANPTNAPLYHSLAELEASVFNLEGLAKLNKRAAAIFSHNGSQSQRPANNKAPTIKVWEKKLQAGASSSSDDLDLNAADSVVGGVMTNNGQSTAFFGDTLTNADPDSILRNMSNLEGDVVGDIFSFTADDMEQDRASNNHKRSLSSPDQLED